MVHADRHTSRPAQPVRSHGVYHGDLSRYGVHHRVDSGAPSPVQTILPSKIASLVAISSRMLSRSPGPPHTGRFSMAGENCDLRTPSSLSAHCLMYVFSSL